MAVSVVHEDDDHLRVQMLDGRRKAEDYGLEKRRGTWGDICM